MDMDQLIIFSIDKIEFGIGFDVVSSIENIQKFFNVPKTPSYIEGLINLRGQIHTVFNIRKLLDLPCPEFDEINKIIMIKVQDSIMGIIADEVKGVVKLENSESKPPPDVSATTLLYKLISGSIKIGDREILLLDTDNFLATVNG